MVWEWLETGIIFPKPSWLSVKMIFIFYGFSDGRIETLAKMAGVMHEAEHAYSIRSTWWLANDVLFIACVINSPSTFTYYLDLSNFISEFGLSYK